MGKRIHFWVDDWAGCAWYRGHAPGTALKALGHEVTLDVALRADTIEKLDALVLQRKGLPAALQAVEVAKSHGVLTVFDLDDDLWNIHPLNPSYEAWQDPARLGGVESVIRAADRVTTTTSPLKGILRRFNDDVRVVPNMLPAEHWPAEPPLHPRDRMPLVIGWAGSMHHLPDLRMLDGIVHTVLDGHPDTVFYVAGAKEIPLKMHKRIERIESVKIEDLHTLLGVYDIGLAPIVDDQFNQAKSDLKYLEYAMMSVPVVASDAGPYARTITNGEDGLLARNAKDWLKHIRRLVEDYDFRSRIGLAGRKHAESRTIERNVGLWVDALGLEEER